VARTKHGGSILSRGKVLLHLLLDSIAGIYLLVLLVFVLTVIGCYLTTGGFDSSGLGSYRGMVFEKCLDVTFIK